MSTALSLYTPQEQVALAADVWPLANRLASTEFVPKALRDRPEAVMACMIKGAELGIPLLQSLSSIHVIEGRPTMSAELMRAVVLSRGHEIEIVQSSATRCVARGKRSGRETWQQFTRTIDDAKAAGLLGKQVWKSYPADMLLARVTGALCRAVFADCLAGISYTAEELEDGDPTIIDATLEPPAADAPKGRTAKARNAATRTPAPTEPASEPVKPKGEMPLLPGEEADDDIVDAEVVEDDPVAADDVEAADLFPEVVDEDRRVEDPGDRATLPGPARIAMLMNAHGITDRSEKLRAVGEIVGRAVGSSKDLSDEEMQLVITVLAALDEGAPFPWAAAPPVVAKQPARPAPTAARAVSPDLWDAPTWRKKINDAHMKVSAVMPEVRRLGLALDPAVTIASLEEIAGSGIGADLYGWLEDNAVPDGGRS